MNTRKERKTKNSRKRSEPEKNGKNVSPGATLVWSGGGGGGERDVVEEEEDSKGELKKK